MNRRIFIFAVLGGVAGSALAYSALGAFLPYDIFLIKPPVPIAYLCLAGLVVLLFLCGWLAGWMSGASSRRQAMGAGAFTGGISALMVNLSFGEITVGLLGLGTLMHDQRLSAPNEAEVLSLVNDTTNAILSYVSLSVWIAIFLGLFFGALGGWLGGARSKPRINHPPFWQGILVSLFPLSTLLFWGMFRWYFPGLDELNSPQSSSLPSFENFLVLFLGLHLLFLIFLQFVGWRLLKAMPYTAQLPSLKTALLTFFCLVMAVPIALAMMTSTASVNFLCTFVVVLVVLLGGTQMVKKYRKKASQTENPGRGWLRKFFSWLGEVGEPRLLGIYFLFFALLTPLGVYLILREALLRSIGLMGGLLLALIFAFLAFRESRQIRFQEATSMTWVDYSINASMAAFLSSLWLGVNFLPAFVLTFLPLSFLDQGASGTLAIKMNAQEIVNVYLNTMMPFVSFWGIFAAVSAVLAFLAGWLLRRPKDQPSS